MNNMDSRLLYEIVNRPDLIGTVASYDLTSAEEAEDLRHNPQNEFNQHYSKLISDLEQQWPFRKIQQFLLERNKWLHQRAKELIEKTELENRDARTRGESYQKRKRFTSKIDVGHKYINELEEKAREIKETRYSVRGMVSPKDVSLVERFGFARYLKLFY